MQHNQPKDEDNEYGVDVAWQNTLVQIVNAFCAGDFELSKHTINGVISPDADTAIHNREYVDDYGETLVPLSDEVWEYASVLWQGDYWEVILDLCTTEGISDMILSLKVYEIDNELQFVVGLIYVP